MLPPGYPWVPSKKFSPFGPAVWPARGNIKVSQQTYEFSGDTNVLFYNLDNEVENNK